MKQVLRLGFKEIVVDEVPDPVPTPHHVLLKPAFSLISNGTETASIHREGVVRGVVENPSHLQKVWEAMKLNGPMRTLAEVRAKFDEYAVLGYSGAGVLVAKHPTVTDLAVGDRVAYGGEGTGHAETILAGQNLVARVPDTVPLDQACFTTLGSIALNAVRTAAIGIGDVVAVIGVGLVGQLIAQLARLHGAVVIAIDLKPDRIGLAQRLGADHGVVSDELMTKAVSVLTDGRGVDCVVIAAAARSVPCRQAVSISRDRGRLVIVGAVDINLPRQEMYAKEIQLFMSRGYGPGSYDPAYEQQGQDYPFSYVRWTERRNMEEFLRLVAQGRVQLQPLVTHQFALDDAARAYGTIMDPASNSLAVLLRYPSYSNGTAVSFHPKRRIELNVCPPTQSPGPADLNVGVVGAGNFARWVHLPVIRKLPGVTLQAIYSQSGSRGKSYARRFGASYCCSDYTEILQDSKVNLVVIASRHQHHAAQAIAALHAGKHVFVEKPMALTEEECRDLCRAVNDTGRQLTVGFNRRFAPFYIELKRVLRGRSAPAVIHCRVNSPGVSGSYWAADPAIGGAILGEACHFVDLMYWLLESEPTSVCAFSLPDKKEPVGQNNLVASFRFADGSIGNLTYCTIGSQTSGGERVEVYAAGLRGIVANFKRLEITTGRRRARSMWWPKKGHDTQLKSFVTRIREGREPEVTVRDGARATIVCLRMLESARTSSPCAIDLDWLARAR
jgi:predicted dehydrogenase